MRSWQGREGPADDHPAGAGVAVREQAMSEFFPRLRKRKLVQWALAYIAATSALIQVLDIVAQRFAWPEQAIRVVIIAMTAGFFVTLVLAWYHGERGAQRVTSTEVLILAALLAAGGLAV